MHLSPLVVAFALIAAVALPGCAEGDNLSGRNTGAGAGGNSPASGGLAGAPAKGGATSAGGAVGGGGAPAGGGATAAGGATPGTGGSPEGGITSDDAGGAITDAGDGGTPPPDDGGSVSDGGFVPTGPALTLPSSNGVWQYYEFTDTHCRNGTTAGIVLNTSPGAKKLLIYMEGGGACFNSTLCGYNPFDTVFQRTPVTGPNGILNRGNAANPVRDWNFVYVPYCTGDVHLGTNPKGSVAGVAGTQMFVGRLNLRSFLNRLVPTFPQTTDVLVTGVDAGGFGAAASVELVQSAFRKATATFIDDSGPPMSSQYIPSCLQSQWRDLWGLDKSVLADCGKSCPNKNDYMLDYAKHIANKYAGRSSGLISSDSDGTITVFYGYGSNQCGTYVRMPAATFKAGLLDFRTTITNLDPNFGTFFPTGTQHEWLADATFYSATIGTKKLTDWVKDIVTGNGPGNYP